MSPVALARLESRLRPLLVRLPPRLAVRLYSAGRRRFLARLVAERPEPYEPPPELARSLWGLRFRAPLGNAAGMFKDGGGYELAWRQGAGFWLAGTTTALPRGGNRGNGEQPFAPYPRSGAASNWLGLPNEGDEAVAARLARVAAEVRREDCPVGASTAAVAAPELSEEDAVAGLVEALRLYEKAGVDFLELNESCPNTGEARPLDEQWRDLDRRLERVGEGFLARRRRPLPVIVKFSVDTELAQVGELVGRLVELGFDGVDFGNTSTDYAGLRETIAAPERPLFDHFTRRYGGGVSGRPLKERSLTLAQAAADHLRSHPSGREFHVIRTGGIETGRDLAASLAGGASLCGWFTGYFEAFAKYGHSLYRRVYSELLATETAAVRQATRRASQGGLP